MMNVPTNENLTPEEEQKLKEQYDKAVEFIKILGDFTFCLIFFSLFRLTTLEVGLCVFTSLSLLIIYLGAREKSMCLLFLGFIFSMFWFIFFVMKIIKDIHMFNNPRINTLFIVWMMILDGISCIVFFILLGLCLKGYLVSAFIIFYEQEGNLKKPLTNNEETPKKDFGTMNNPEQNQNENKIEINN